MDKPGHPVRPGRHARRRAARPDHQGRRSRWPLDERQFVDPYRFDVGRNPNYHLGYGHGAHFCLGANLARWELRALFRELAKRDILGRIELEPEAEWMTDLHVGTLTKQMVRLID